MEREKDREIKREVYVDSEAGAWLNVGLGVFLSDLLTNGQWDVYFNKYCSKFLSLIMT